MNGIPSSNSMWVIVYDVNKAADYCKADAIALGNILAYTTDDEDCVEDTRGSWMYWSRAINQFLPAKLGLHIACLG